MIQTKIFGGGIKPVQYSGKWSVGAIADRVRQKNSKAPKAFFQYVDSDVKTFEIDLQTLAVERIK